MRLLVVAAQLRAGVKPLLERVSAGVLNSFCTLDLLEDHVECNLQPANTQQTDRGEHRTLDWYVRLSHPLKGTHS